MIRPGLFRSWIHGALGLGAALAITASGCSGQRDAVGTDVDSLVRRNADESLDAFLSRVRDRHGVPAIAAAVFTEDRLLEVAALGASCRGSDAHVTVDSRFHIGSLVKSMTSVIAALLVEAGRLRWETTLGGAFRELAAMDPVYRDVTLADVLRHRGGFAPWWSDDDEFAVHELVPGLEGSGRRQRERFVEWRARWS